MIVMTDILDGKVGSLEAFYKAVLDNCPQAQPQADTILTAVSQKYTIWARRGESFDSFMTRAFSEVQTIGLILDVHVVGLMPNPVSVTITYQKL